MRAVLVVGLCALLCPAVALAQTAAAPASTAPATPTAAPSRSGDITRDQYIERAKHSAAARFDRMDTDHDGVLTAEERRAARKQRSAAPSQ